MRASFISLARRCGVVAAAGAALAACTYNSYEPREPAQYVTYCDPVVFDVYFDADSAEIRREEAVLIGAAVDEAQPFFLGTDGLDQCRIQHVYVVGHTDTVGGEKTNLKLGEARAKMVEATLIASTDLTKEMIEIATAGEKINAIATGDVIANPTNRRAEVWLMTTAVPARSEGAPINEDLVGSLENKKTNSPWPGDWRKAKKLKCKAVYDYDAQGRRIQVPKCDPSAYPHGTVPVKADPICQSMEYTPTVCETLPGKRKVCHNLTRAQWMDYVATRCIPGFHAPHPDDLSRPSDAPAHVVKDVERGHGHHKHDDDHHHDHDHGDHGHGHDGDHDGHHH